MLKKKVFNKLYFQSVSASFVSVTFFPVICKTALVKQNQCDDEVFVGYSKVLTGQPPSKPVTLLITILIYEYELRLHPNI